MTARNPAILIALGANRPSEQGGPRETLEAALALLRARGIAVEACSRWFSSPAWPAGSGPDYVNGAARLRSGLAPADLLDALHRVETILGRTRDTDERWAARPCDLDLVAHGAMVSPGTIGWRKAEAAPPETPRDSLILPHPQMHRRAFALGPLADIAPDWRHPVLGQTVAEMLAGLPGADRTAITPLP